MEAAAQTVVKTGGTNGVHHNLLAGTVKRVLMENEPCLDMQGYLHLSCEETSSKCPHTPGQTAPPGRHLALVQAERGHQSGCWEATGRAALCKTPCSAWGRKLPPSPAPTTTTPSSRSPPTRAASGPNLCPPRLPRSQSLHIFGHEAGPVDVEGELDLPEQRLHEHPRPTQSVTAKAQLGCFRLNWPFL